MFSNAPNKKTPPAPITRRSRCWNVQLAAIFYRPDSFAPRAFARFAGCIRDIAQCILNFFFFLVNIAKESLEKIPKRKNVGDKKR